MELLKSKVSCPEGFTAIEEVKATFLETILLARHEQSGLECILTRKWCCSTFVEDSFCQYLSKAYLQRLFFLFIFDAEQIAQEVHAIEYVEKHQKKNTTFSSDENCVAYQKLKMQLYSLRLERDNFYDLHESICQKAVSLSNASKRICLLAMIEHLTCYTPTNCIFVTKLIECICLLYESITKLSKLDFQVYLEIFLPTVIALLSNHYNGVIGRCILANAGVFAKIGKSSPERCCRLNAAVKSFCTKALIVKNRKIPESCLKRHPKVISLHRRYLYDGRREDAQVLSENNTLIVLHGGKISVWQVETLEQSMAICPCFEIQTKASCWLLCLNENRLQVGFSNEVIEYCISRATEKTDSAEMAKIISSKKVLKYKGILFEGVDYYVSFAEEIYYLAFENEKQCLGAFGKAPCILKWQCNLIIYLPESFFAVFNLKAKMIVKKLMRFDFQWQHFSLPTQEHDLDIIFYCSVANQHTGHCLNIFNVATSRFSTCFLRNASSLENILLIDGPLIFFSSSIQHLTNGCCMTVTEYKQKVFNKVICIASQFKYVLVDEKGFSIFIKLLY